MSQGLCTRVGAGRGLCVLTGTPGSPEGPASPSSPARPCTEGEALSAARSPSAQDSAGLASPLPPGPRGEGPPTSSPFSPLDPARPGRPCGTEGKGQGTPEGRGAPAASLDARRGPHAGAQGDDPLTAPGTRCGTPRARTGCPLGPFSPGAPVRPASPCRRSRGDGVRPGRLSSPQTPCTQAAGRVQTFSPSSPAMPSLPSLPGMPWGQGTVRPGGQRAPLRLLPPPAPSRPPARAVSWLRASGACSPWPGLPAQWPCGDLSCPQTTPVRGCEDRPTSAHCPQRCPHVGKLRLGDQDMGP